MIDYNAVTFRKNILQRFSGPKGAHNHLFKATLWSFSYSTFWIVTVVLLLWYLFSITMTIFIIDQPIFCNFSHSLINWHWRLSLCYWIQSHNHLIVAETSLPTYVPTLSQIVCTTKVTDHFCLAGSCQPEPPGQTWGDPSSSICWLRPHRVRYSLG